MKKIIILAAFAAAVLSACTKETSSINTPQLQTVHFNAGALDSKALFGTPEGNVYPVLWSDNDTDVALSVNLGAIQQVPITAKSEDHKTASFSYDTPSASSYRFAVVSPYLALRSINKDAQKVRVEVPAGQQCTDASPDEDAIVLGGLSDEITELPASVDIDMSHIPAYLHIHITNADLQGGTVQSVNIVSAKKLVGRFYYKANKTCEADETGMFGTVGVVPESLDHVWAGVFPADLSHETIGVQVVTSKGTLSRGIQFGAGHAMESGKIYSFTVNMAGVPMGELIEYEKVTDVSQLNHGDFVLIVGETSDVALSTAQNSNNRSAAGISRTADGSKVLNPSSAVEIISLENGLKSGQWALRATSAANPGYLYAADPDNSKNYLRTTAALTDPSASWVISINDDENKTAAIAADLEARHNLLRFNEDSNLFSAYGASTSMKKVMLYRKTGGAFLVTMPTYSASIEGASASFPVNVFGNVAWNAEVTGGGSLDVTSGTGPATLTLTIPENPDTVNPRDITVTVSTAAEVGTKSYQFTITQGPKPAAVEFPIVWSMPAISASWQDGVDFHCEYAYSWVYSDTHDGRLSINRFGTNPSTAPNYKYFDSPTSSEVLANGRLYSCGVYEGDYWLFEVFNVKNPAGTYSISYKTCSTNAAPRVFLLQYSVDDGANWVNINATTSALKLKDGTSYDGGKEYTYTYTTSSAPDYVNNEIKTVNEEFHIGAITETITLKIRAIVACKMNNAGSGNMNSNHHGGAHRLGENVTITFTAD